MRRRAQQLALIVGVMAVATALPASAADQQVSGTVAPMEGIAIGSTGATGGTMDVTVVREQRGDTLYVTVIPR